MRVLTLVSVVLLTAALASATPIWSVDFESGFTASSGTADVHLGNLADPENTAGDTNIEVYVDADPLNTSNKALEVEMRNAAKPRSHLGYSIPSSVQPAADIRISWRDYYANDDRHRAYMPFNLTGGSAAINNESNMVHLSISAYADGMTAGTAQLWAYTRAYKPDAYSASHTFALPPFQANSWNDFSLHWVYRGICETTELPYANVSLEVNGECMGSATMTWADWTANMISIGCKWNGGPDNYSVSQRDSMELGDLIDDVVITPEPATALLLLSGCLFFRKRK